MACDSEAATSSYLGVAKAAERWLWQQHFDTDQGIAWHVAPDEESYMPLGMPIDASIYYGQAGILLFYLELYHTTGEASYLEKAEAAAEYLINIESSQDAHKLWVGLYLGIAGIAVVLENAYRVTGASKYRKAAQRYTRQLIERAKQTAAGVAWLEPQYENSEYWDITNGSSGIGLTLLETGVSLGIDEAHEIAIAAGNHLLQVAEPVKEGLLWLKARGRTEWAPNFSHGTAGVAYFLTRLYEETGNHGYLDAAIAGARHLIDIANRDDDRFLIYRAGPIEKEQDLYYIAWCHGPAGTARLFYALQRATGDDSWFDFVLGGARGIEALEAPGKPSPGNWYNIGQCCGAAGIGEFYLALYRITGDVHYLEFAQTNVANYILAEATTVDSGLKWRHSEERQQPEWLLAQTGLMQGAAGIGAFHLHLHNQIAGRHSLIQLPDSPWPT